jgi:N12 class adenine-specific DNA methylase/SAM-dependent methyltransferase
MARETVSLVELQRRITDEFRPPTDDERRRFSAWMGWGAVAPAFDPRAKAGWAEVGAQLRLLLSPEELAAAEAATPTSFFTDPALADAVWRLARGLGFDGGGRVLEAGCGTGSFMATAPQGADLRWTGVERDPFSAAVAQLRFPDATVIAKPLEKVTLPNGAFDLVIGNVPFADVPIYDRDAPRLSLHNYFIWRALSAVRPGGMVVVVTSRYTMDNSAIDQREALAQLGDLVGAIRLPSGALDAAGTKVVADIVALRRRADGQSPRGPSWRDPDYQVLADVGINEYFATRPDRIVGQPVWGHGLYRPELLITPPPDVPAALEVAIDQVVDEARRQQLTYQPRGADGPGATRLVLTDAQGRKEGSFHVVDGVVRQVRDGKLERVTTSAAELRVLIGLRDTALALLAAEADPHRSDDSLTPLRTDLNRRYDRYRATYGPINRAKIVQGKVDAETGLPSISRRRPAMGGFRQDPDYVVVLALEDYDDDTGEAHKAPIFQRRVNRRPVRPDHADTPAEALALCLDQLGHLDFPTIAGLLRTDPDSVVGQLGDLVYEDPATRRWATAAEYLSGDVRHKLAVATVAAEADLARWGRNVAALQAVVPEDLGPAQIAVRLGAPWIDAADVAQFLGETLGQRPNVTHERLTASWDVEIASWYTQSAAATVDWGTDRINAYRLAQIALNGAAATVYDEITDENGNTRRVKNVPETLAAEEKLRALNERFAQWVWEEPERTDRLVERYNRVFNSVVPRRYDGSHLSFPGLIDGFDPYPHQRDIVWRIVSSPSALCAHPVGAGKTASMVASAMTLRRLGLANKPMIIVPNHLLEQVARDAKRLFPAAKVLMVGKEDLTKDRRQLFAARAATGDWDLIVMTHTGFGSLPVYPSTEADFLEEQIALYRQTLSDNEDAGRASVKRINVAIEKMRQRQAELRDTRTDDGVFWEQLGVDYLMADEAHLFKSLPIPARMEGFSLPASKRAVDLALKLKLLRARNDGARWGAFFTGTPVSNTLAELFILQMYLQPDRLAEVGMETFDAWGAQFIEWVTRVEVAPDGGSYRVHRRPARFMNVPELRRLISEFADVRPKDAFGLELPEVEHHTIALEASEGVRWLVNRLVQRADRIRSGQPMEIDGRKDNMLWVCGDGRKAALDLSLVGYPMPRPPKVDAVAAEILKAWRPSLELPEGPCLQVVFCDMGTPREGDSQVYGKIRAALVGAGMPASAIRFVHDAKTDAARTQLFADCRSGKVQLLIGSTEKLGTGVNIQNRLAAIHHLDAPWRPADVEQRDGRGDRPGNRHAVVSIFRYVTSGTFDSFMWQTLERKAIFIAQLFTGDPTAREVEDLGDGVLSYSEVKAAATGDPLVMELAEVQAEVSRLRTLATEHTRALRRAAYSAGDEERRAEWADARAATLQTIADAAANNPAALVPHRDGATLADRNPIAAHLGEALQRAINTGLEFIDVGRWAGSRVAVRAHMAGKTPLLTLEIGGQSSSDAVAVELKPGYLQASQHWRILDRAEEIVATAADEATKLRQVAERSRTRRAELLAVADRPFEHAERLAAAVSRKEAIEEIMRAQAEEATQQQRNELDDELPAELRAALEAAMAAVTEPAAADTLAEPDSAASASPLDPPVDDDVALDPVDLESVLVDVTSERYDQGVLVAVAADPDAVPTPRTWTRSGRDVEAVTPPALAAIAPLPRGQQLVIDVADATAARTRRPARSRPSSSEEVTGGVQESLFLGLDYR